MPNPDENSVTTTVFFDGSCPLCRWEISLYQGAVPTSPIQWVDVSDTKQKAIEGCSCRELMARFHVQTKEGAMLSGAAAFVALWLIPVVVLDRKIGLLTRYASAAGVALSWLLAPASGHPVAGQTIRHCQAVVVQVLSGRGSLRRNMRQHGERQSLQFNKPTL